MKANGRYVRKAISDCVGVDVGAVTQILRMGAGPVVSMNDVIPKVPAER